MRIFNEFPFPIEPKPRAIALGFFDGVHLGHQKLINEMIAISKVSKLTATIFTFGDHPNSNFNGDVEFSGLIQNSDLRVHKFTEFGVDEVILAPMNSQVRKITAYDFFHKYLMKQFGMQALVVGKDARFGYKGEGNIDLLQKWSKENGIDLLIVGDVKTDNHRISSTLIRKFIENGEIKEANKCLGYNYIIQGEVIHGKKLGRTLGFPTINILFDHNLVKPRFGVYVSNVRHKDNLYPSITSIGTNPTVSDTQQIKVETYIYNKNIDLYEEQVLVELIDFVRPEINFDSIESMKERILMDLDLVKKIHAEKCR